MHTIPDDFDFTAFTIELARLGGSVLGNRYWLCEAFQHAGGDDDMRPESLAWLCANDELSNLEHDDPRAEILRRNLEAARS